MTQARIASASNESSTTVVEWDPGYGVLDTVVVQSGGDTIIFESTTGFRETVESPFLSYGSRAVYRGM